MSSLFALGLGLQVGHLRDGPLSVLLNAAALLPIDTPVDDYAREVAAKAKELSPQAEWFIAMADHGRLDMDI